MNIGELLQKEIVDKGYKKERIAEKLSMSWPTLKKRLLDGDFKFNEVNVLMDNRYIPDTRTL